jgi:hypothetical protein
MLSQGNSGGPLIDEKGELVGVNTLAVSDAQQLNFSLESRVLKRIVSDIIKNGKVVRAFLGIEAAEFVKYNLEEQNKVQAETLTESPVLWHILPGSPAEKLKELLGYSISEINGVKIHGNEDLLDVLESVKPKEKVEFGLEKDGVKVVKSLTAEPLTDKRLAETAHFYFKEHFNISLEDNSSGVIMNYPVGAQENALQYFDKEEDRFITYLPRGERAYILACGNSKDIKDSDLWKTDTYKDLGNALRLSVPNGLISFLEYDTEHEPLFIRGLISDRKDLIGKSVLY